MQDQSPIFILIVIGCLMMVIMALSIILFVVRHQRKMHENEKLIQAIENEKQIALFKVSMEAEERQKEIIANNLHDSIKPMLTYLKYSLTSHQSSFLNNKFSDIHLDKDKQTIDQIINDIRATCHDLIPSVLNSFGLVKALEDSIDAFNRSELISASMNSDKVTTDFSKISKIDLVNMYRVCQELMTNILKHSGCKNLSLIAFSDQNKLCLEFAYDGKGITDEEIEKLSQKGLGLNSLKTRVLVLNATLNYLRGENAFEIKFHVPVAA